MKIENDLRTQVQGRPVSRQAARTADAPGPRNISSQEIGSPISNRSLTNAMVMLQKAQALVQEALSVSGRLQSLAAESLRTGNTDIQEVARELAGIDSALSQYGASSPNPAVQQSSGTEDRLARVRADVGEMREMAAREIVDKERIAAIQSSLKESERVFSDEFKTEAARIMPADPFKNAFSRPAFDTIKGDIISNPAMSLGAQGNLTAATVNYLAG